MEASTTAMFIGTPISVAFASAAAVAMRAADRVSVGGDAVSGDVEADDGRGIGAIVIDGEACL